MRLRNIPYAKEKIQISPYVIKDSTIYKGNMASMLFENTNPIHIEIGMGKGRFLMEMARRNPNINYIGIEMYSSVLVRAIQKLEQKENEGAAPKNLRFLCMDARLLSQVFAKNEVEKIYLNFSDPWPKDRHAKRRLMSRQFLSIYDTFLQPQGTLEFKTDNRALFDFAIEELSHTRWKAIDVTYDLHHDERMNEGNVMTEYEEKFSAKGNPICKYIISRS